jgi:hypothetical protein
MMRGMERISHKDTKPQIALRHVELLIEAPPFALRDAPLRGTSG